jgi:ABC-type Co2+ transport system permease subunit|tara:strand:+ start:944 stop:1168 length:225 start_codon:yes stop_codon:yes gene_type:complete
VAKSTLKNTLKRRSTWVAAMAACFIFLLMAVKVYEVPAATMTTNLIIVILGLAVIMAIAAIIGRLMLLLRKRKK